MPTRVRELDKKSDRRAIEAIDTAFDTDTIFELALRERSIELVERELATPLTKRYSIREVFAPWARWQRGWVIDDGAVRGFAAVEHEPWHERIVLWFLYIDLGFRRHGFGRALLEQVEAYGRDVEATHVWLETSNVNVPGVRAYERLGYTLCGAELTTTDRTCQASRRSTSPSPCSSRRSVIRDARLWNNHPGAQDYLRSAHHLRCSQSSRFRRGQGRKRRRYRAVHRYRLEDITMKKCRACREGELVVTRKNHRYTESGLSNVVLQDVEVRSCPHCGDEQIVLPRITELHRAIALAVVRTNARLRSEEVRFLRKYMGLSGSDFAARMGVDPATVSRWENGHDPIGPLADRLLRLMVVRDRPVEEYPLEELVNIVEKEKHPLIRLRADREGWHQASIAA